MHYIDYSIIAVYLIGMVVVGLWMQRKAAAGIDSYFLGDRSLPWWMLGASGMASNLDITGTMINIALVFVLGVGGFFVEIRGGVVLMMAILMIFMGKWNRRSQVMTFAEWMRFRFGKGRQGDAARLISAVGTLVLTVAMVTYFCTGAGKFIAEFLSIPPMLGLPPRFWGALGMISLAMTYTVMSGFYGVIWTDLLQSGLILAAIIYVCFVAVTRYPLPEAFSISVPMRDGTFRTLEAVRSAWTSLVPPSMMQFDPDSGYVVFNLFRVAIVFYFFKTMIEGLGGGTGYMAQRYFAIKQSAALGQVRKDEQVEPRSQ